MGDDGFNRAEGKVTTTATGGGGCGSQQSEQNQLEAQFEAMKREERIRAMGSNIKRKIMVLSGKGGVGKSTVATGLALSLAAQGEKVGVLDIDITGPNVPKMLGLDDARVMVEDGQLLPPEGHLGVKVISMAFLMNDPDAAVIWRGPLKLGAIQQFIGDVAWGELDTLIIDFPPGTSDEPLTIAQKLPDIDGMVIVTTPQDVAVMDSRRAINFGQVIEIPVLGVIENMSGFTLRGTALDASGNPLNSGEIEILGPDAKPLAAEIGSNGEWKAVLDLFKTGGGEAAARKFKVPYLGSLPFDPAVVLGSDSGVHNIVTHPEGETALAFAKIVENLQNGLK